MNHIDEIFLRADIQQVREFLLHGAECAADMRTYDERMESADRKVCLLYTSQISHNQCNMMFSIQFIDITMCFEIPIFCRHFYPTYFPIIQVINVILPRIIQQRIRMEYINTTVSYTHLDVYKRQM